MAQNKDQKHFVFIIGTRAQLIKVAPVIVECEQQNLPCTLLMTGQHLETMQDLLAEFGIETEQTAATTAKEHATVLSLITWLPRAYTGIIKQLKSIKLKPKHINILVHGDTLSTVLGALAGRQLGASVVHLESGLTSKHILDPFPEEISRRIVFRLSNIAMCPNSETEQHMRLKYPNCQAINTNGNTILDAIRLTGVSRVTRPQESNHIVASLHRFQNIYDTKRLSKLVELLEEIADTHTIYFVLHPATRKRLDKTGLSKRLEEHKGIKLLPRLGYSEFLRLAAESACVLTDGGSNQEELAALGVPTIVMRQATERSDGLGKNAIMEGELSAGVFNYIKRKEYRALDLENNDTHFKHPSSHIIDYLTRTP
ncbi:UDP-N-acetylglucosamine 2-epimerase [Ectopseudomonas khazarica]|uniref:UDP-N-acetylglucosamine 2-epimerase n=1 Tax=Ectopseudomonas khazarica TaxID=2502979 RepID=UPI003B936A94